MLMIRGEIKRKIFDLKRSINLKSTKMFGLNCIGKHLKSNKKFIRFTILIGILSILMPPIPNRYFFDLQLQPLIRRINQLSRNLEKNQAVAKNIGDEKYLSQDKEPFSPLSYSWLMIKNITNVFFIKL